MNKAQRPNQNGKPISALGKLYARQQAKIKTNERQAKLLKTFAEDDYKRIAKLIQSWLDKDSS